MKSDAARGTAYLDDFVLSLAGELDARVFVLGCEPGCRMEVVLLAASVPGAAKRRPSLSLRELKIRDVLHGDLVVLEDEPVFAGDRFPGGPARSCAAHPLNDADGRIIGAIVAMWEQPGSRARDCVPVLHESGPRVAAEVESLLLAAESARFEQRCRLVSEVTHALLQSRPSREQLESAMEIVCARMDVDAASLRTVDDGELELVSCAGIPPAQRVPRLPANQGIAREIMASHRPLTIEYVPNHPATAPKVEARPGSFQFQSFAGAPLMSDGVVTGILGVYTTGHTRVFTPADLGQLQILANFFALSLLNRDLFEAINRHLVEVHQSRLARQGAAE